MDDLGILISLASLGIGLLCAIIGLVGLSFGLRSNKKLEALRVVTDDMAVSLSVLLSAIRNEAAREGRTVRAEIKDAMELGDRAVVKVIPSSKMEFTGYPPSVSVAAPGESLLWG